MVKRNVRDVQRKLGFDVEPLLSAKHQERKSLLDEVNVLCEKYVNYTPGALEKGPMKPSFRSDCRELFRQFGPRIWTGRYSDVVRDRTDRSYPRALRWENSGDNKRLWNHFFQFVSNK